MRRHQAVPEDGHDRHQGGAGLQLVSAHHGRGRRLGSLPWHQLLERVRVGSQTAVKVHSPQDGNFNNDYLCKTPINEFCNDFIYFFAKTKISKYNAFPCNLKNSLIVASLNVMYCCCCTVAVAAAVIADDCLNFN